MNLNRTSTAAPPRIVRLDLMWMIGAPLIAFFGVGGLLFWIFLPRIGIGPIWFAVSLVLLTVYGVITWSVRRRRRRAEHLLRVGLPGFARILEAEGTGVSVNHRPQVRLRLRVELPGRAPYETELREVLPFLGLESVGPERRVPVVVDPENPQELIIDWSGAASVSAARSAQDSGRPSPASSSVSTRLARLQQLRDAGQITSDEYASQRQRILTEL
jgi:hypothetical protein